MNEAQTLIDLEKFMSLVCKRDYHWKDFASDYEQWLDDARTIYDEELEYSPLLQAYFDLIPERMDWYDQEVFENRRAFSDFQKNLKIRQQSFLNDFTIKVEDNILINWLRSIVNCYWYGWIYITYLNVVHRFGNLIGMLKN